VKKYLKRGMESQRKAEVDVIAGSIHLEGKDTGRISRFCGYFKMGFWAW
jgi:hypothetical protein